MTNNSIFLHYVNDGFTQILKAEKNVIKASRTGVFICLNGEVDCTIDGKSYHVVAHSIITYFAFSELNIIRRSADLKGIVIGGNLEAIQPLLYKISDFNSLFLIRNNPFKLLSERQEKNMIGFAGLINDVIERINGRIDAEQEQTIPLKEMRLMQLEMLANSFMLNVVSCYTNFDAQSKLTNRKEDVLVRFVTSLYKNYVTEHEVGFYAEQQYLTSRYFSAIIKDKSGRTPSQWIATALLVDAKNKLRQTTLTVKEIRMLIDKRLIESNPIKCFAKVLPESLLT